MTGLTKFEYNLIALLLDDRATLCVRNASVCNEFPVLADVTDYWNQQKDIAYTLAIKFRKAGKDRCPDNSLSDVVSELAEAWSRSRSKMR